MQSGLNKWTNSFKFLDIKDETYKVHISSDSTEFRNAVVKLYLIDNDNTENYPPSIADCLPFAQDLLYHIALLPTTKMFSTPITKHPRV